MLGRQIKAHLQKNSQGGSFHVHQTTRDPIELKKQSLPPCLAQLGPDTNQSTSRRDMYYLEVLYYQLLYSTVRKKKGTVLRHDKQQQQSTGLKRRVTRRHQDCLLFCFDIMKKIDMSEETITNVHEEKDKVHAVLLRQRGKKSFDTFGERNENKKLKNPKLKI